MFLKKILKVTYLQNAAVTIENSGEKILCDPWLIPGCYYGAWHHYPKFNFIGKEFDDIDYIYISHIHPDHFDIKTMEKLKKDIPVLIHEFPQKFLKANIEKLGFKVEELAHNKRTNLGKTWINILAADDCNPEICSRSFGCSFEFNKFGTNQIDTLSVIDNDEQVIVNSNDCPWEIGATTAKKIKEQYDKIDLLLVGYTGASDYPSCYDLPIDEKEKEAEKKKLKRLRDAESYINMFNPKFYMPFAGRYVLGGKLTSLMKYKGESTQDEGINYLLQKINQDQNMGIALNIKSYFDLDTKLVSDPYVPENKQEREEYIQNVLSKLKLDYEYEEYPKIESILELIPKAYDRFEQHRKMINYSVNTSILIELDNENMLLVSVNGNGFKIIKRTEINNYSKYLYLSLDTRLLYKILQNSKKAHWNNAEIGCHILWKRTPNEYDRALMYCLNFFHN
jgi:UDP-MurNAc hydroxylase